MKRKLLSICIILMLVVLNFIVLFTTVANADGQPQWPTTWILADTDPNENGGSDDFRDVHFVYYYEDNDYLYFRLECFGFPNFTDEPESRYKWFIDIDDPYNMAWQGGKVWEAEYLLFVEDSPKPGGNGIGDIYLLDDVDGDGLIGDDWPDYLNTPGPILNTSIAGYRIINNCIDIYIRQTDISNPPYSYFTWATDQEDPNLDSTSENDRSNSYWTQDLSKADISIEKSDSIDPVYSGGSFSYILYVENHGPHVALNVNVTDVLPAGVTYVNAVPAPSGNNGSTYWWNIDTLSVSDSLLITINVNVSSGFTGNITNIAHAYNDTRDPMIGNNEDTEQTSVIYMADLSITKSANVQTAYPWEYIEYSLNVTNNGPNTAVNVNVTDVLPVEVSFVGSNLPYGFSGSTYWWNLGSIAVGESVEILINVSVNNVPAVTINNTATVSSDTYDPTPGNSGDSEQITMGCSADLSITKTANANVVYPGDYLTYTIVVTNNGPDVAVDVVVCDELPSEVSFVSADPHYNASLMDSVYWWYLGSLEPYESKTITVNVTVNNVSGGTIINNTVNVTSDTYDQTPGNSDVSEEITVGSNADLSITKVANTNFVYVGDYIIYTLNVTNNGPDVASNVVVYDELPSQVTFNSSNPAPSGSNNLTYWWNIGSLDFGESVEITITVVVKNIQAGTINNIAYVTSNTTYDPTPDNNEANQDITMNKSADLSIVKSANVTTVHPGDTIQYTINVTNNGPDDAVDVNVTDELSSKVTFASAYPAPSGSNGSTYWWNFDSLGVDESEIIILNVTVNINATGIIINMASVTSSTHDPNPGDESNNGSTNTTIEDNIPPSKVENLTVVDAFNGNLSLSWDPATDNVGVDHYEIFRNGSFLISVNSTSYIDTGLEIGLQYNYTVRAVDTSSNEGEFSDEVGGISSDTIPPSKVENLLAKDAKDGKIDLSWSPATDNVGVDHYEIYRNGSLIFNTTGTSYRDTGLINDHSYNYTVRAVDAAGNKGDYSDPAIGKPTKTKTDTNDNDDDSGDDHNFIPPVEDDKNPTADAGGPYYGFIDTELGFDGSNSKDNDENGESIVRYDWKFFEGDSWHNDSGAKPAYNYSEPGVYNVALRVYDDEGSSDTDTTNVIIAQPNLPPENLTITGPTEGYVDVSYTYNISATDPDGDDITYTVNWGDGTSNVSGALTNGTVYQVSHVWASRGNYTINVSAVDELNAPSNNASLDVQINTPASKEDNTLCYLFLLLLLLLLIAIILYLLKRRRKKEESQNNPSK